MTEYNATIGIKKLILTQLKEGAKYVSGQQLSEMIGVSRTAIWKHINELKTDGYEIESSSRKGYRLVSSPDLLNQRELIVPEGQIIGAEIVHFDEIDSTNSYAKKIANEGCKNGTVIIAEKQTLGRGRIGRVWSSNNSAGIWMSIILKPDLDPEQVQIITLAASVAIVEAIEETQGITCGIKWPNDIILKSAKMGGILTELSAEPGHVNYVVVGIGLNINQELEDFDEDIKDKAISLKMVLHKTISRVNILNNIFVRFNDIYTLLLENKTAEILERWTKYSLTVGSEVKVSFRDVQHIGIAEGIASDGKLIVRCNDGVVREIAAGEIQVRGLLGYI